MSTVTSKQQLSNPDLHPRYTDQSYPGHSQYISSYYHISFSGAAHQHEKYLALKVALLNAIDYCLKAESPLSSQLIDLKDWMLGSAQGFTCQHMPWQVMLEAELYKPLAYVLTKHDTPASRAAYHSMRRYGEWV